VEWIIVFLLLVALAYLGWQNLQLSRQIESRARELNERWRRTELNSQVEQGARALFQEWALTEEPRIREDAIRRSEAVIKGKVTEHLIPFFPSFKYNPKDARFIGTPIDLILFDGLSEGELRQIVFLEVKTGRSASLSGRERLVKHCVMEGKIGYEILRVEGVEKVGSQ